MATSPPRVSSAARVSHIERVAHGAYRLASAADAFVDAIRRYGSTSLDVRRLERLLGTEAYGLVLRDAGIGEEGPRRLVRLDSLGHAAIAEGAGT